MDLMKTRRRKSKGSSFLKKPITFIFLVVSICCILLLTISTLRLPVIPKSNKGKTAVKAIESASEEFGLSKYGEMVLKMLPDDLAFTVFLPSEKAFERDMRLRANATVMPVEEADNVYAMLTRVMGFTAVPRKVYTNSVSVGEEICFDSVSGFRLFVSKDVDGRLIVNRVKSERVNMSKGEIVVHVMDGVIMDAEFAQSVEPDVDEENKR